jgi:hypothetical protein
VYIFLYIYILKKHSFLTQKERREVRNKERKRDREKRAEQRIKLDINENEGR